MTRPFDLPKIQLGEHMLPHNVVLAPMTEMTDQPARQIAMEQGCGLVVSEMIAAEGVVRHADVARQKASFAHNAGIKSVVGRCFPRNDGQCG